ncbi:MAG: HAD family hydrolase [Lachnospiraceae bacterium]|nr:HAD family hydrolase [Lachnospiraceae bacterium]
MNQLQTDALIFDVDGTLWDTTELCAIAWNRVIKAHSNLPANVTAQQLKGLFGKPMDVIFRTIWPQASKEEQESLAKLCVKEENEMLVTTPGIPYPEVKETLAKLSEELPLFIVSNCQSGYIEVCMSGLGIEAYITDFACFGDHPVSKGQNILEIMHRHGLKNPVYIGDTQSDADACKEAGIRICYASYGFGNVEAPDAVITQIGELPKLIGMTK